MRVGHTIAVAGTGPIAADGTTVCAGDAFGQAKRCLEIIETALVEAGGQLSDVVRTRMYVTDMSKWQEIGKAHGEVFADIRPASTLVEVTALARADWLVEIEADAILTD